ncbi:MAG: NAD(P)/FAD-dependent oxidoreductase [Microthrixaceae bacterium]
MVHRSYDAIVIGAGHNGLCTAAYLARAGLKTAIVERRHEEGGGVNTEEPLRPGFRFNLHAQFMEFFDIMPMIQDFDLESLGLRTIVPEAQAGIAFADGRPPVILHRPDLLDRTHASIARYSRSDADTYVDLKRRAQAIQQMLAVGLYNPPTAQGDATQAMILESVFGDIGITSHFATKSPKVVIDELFETDELRALLYRCCVEFGFPVDQTGTGAGFLTFVMWTMANWKLVLGGTHTLAKAMTQACYREGVELIENNSVSGIIIEDGRAVGVHTRTGDIRATKCVASNANVQQTLLDLVGEENLSELWIKRAKAFRSGPSHVLGTPMFCLHDAPDYLSAAHDPEINRTFYTLVGYESARECIDYIRDAYMGRMPSPGAGLWVNSLWDRSQAPPGHHSATGWYFLPPASDLSAEEWAHVRATFNDRFLARWREAAPNMTPGNVIEHRVHTPDLMERKNMILEGDFSNGEFSPDQMGINRPFPEASQYRAEIEGLYFCGPSSYPGGGVHSACGYNAYKTIAEDLDLPSPVVSSRGY